MKSIVLTISFHKILPLKSVVEYTLTLKPASPYGVNGTPPTVKDPTLVAPATFKDVNVPTEVTLGWAAVVKRPSMVVADKLLIPTILLLRSVTSALPASAVPIVLTSV